MHIVILLILFSLILFFIRGRKKRLEAKLGIRIVCISYTHGDHRKLSESLPSGDILIHAGDFTRFGRLDDARDFNEWLSEMKNRGSFQHVLVTNGNHENNVRIVLGFTSKDAVMT